MPKLVDSLVSAKTSCNASTAVLGGYGANTRTGPSVRREDAITSTPTISRAPQADNSSGTSDRNVLAAPLSTSYDTLRDRKPDCSYAVLIGIAMRAARAANFGERLPVIDIYRFIEWVITSPIPRACALRCTCIATRHCTNIIIWGSVLTATANLYSPYRKEFPYFKKCKSTGWKVQPSPCLWLK